MTLQECYARLGGDYEDVFSRLRSERLIQKFIIKFLDDGNFDLLCRSVESGDVSEAFRAAHTIKGMCQNLSFTALAESDSALTEVLRKVEMENGALFAKVKEDYERTVSAIRDYKEVVQA